MTLPHQTSERAPFSPGPPGGGPPAGEPPRPSPVELAMRYRAGILTGLAVLALLSIVLAYLSRPGLDTATDTGATGPPRSPEMTATTAQAGAGTGGRSTTTSGRSSTTPPPGEEPSSQEPSTDEPSTADSFPARFPADLSAEPLAASAGEWSTGPTGPSGDDGGPPTSPPSSTTPTSETGGTDPTTTSATTTAGPSPTTAPQGSTTAGPTTTARPTTTRPTTTTTRPTTTTTRPTTTVLGGNRVVNGSFESPRIGSDYLHVAASPWSSTASGRVEIWRSGLDDIASPAGSQHAELNVDRPATFSQTIQVTPGATYRWSLRHRGRKDRDTLEVRIDGEVVATVSTDQAWRQYSGDVVARSGSIVLSLRAIDSGSIGNLIDDVQLRQVISG